MKKKYDKKSSVVGMEYMFSKEMESLENLRCFKEGYLYLKDGFRFKEDTPDWARKEYEKYLKDFNIE